MKTVKNGDYVKVRYTGKFENGDVFESSSGCGPLEIHMGSNEVLPAFEKALMGMSPNESKTFTLEPAEAYGDWDEELEQTFERSDFPEDFEPELGEMIILESPEQEQFTATVKGIEENAVVLDMNHPLAGRTLTFDVEVVEINDHPTENNECGCGCKH